jgi:hypothetical protein
MQIFPPHRCKRGICVLPRCDIQFTTSSVQSPFGGRCRAPTANAIHGRAAGLHLPGSRPHPCHTYKSTIPQHATSPPRHSEDGEARLSWSALNRKPPRSSKDILPGATRFRLLKRTSIICAPEHLCGTQATMTATATKTEITLKGSVEIVTEFFGYSINRSVLEGAGAASVVRSSQPRLNMVLAFAQSSTPPMFRTCLQHSIPTRHLSARVVRPCCQVRAQYPGDHGRGPQNISRLSAAPTSW